MRHKPTRPTVLVKDVEVPRGLLLCSTFDGRSVHAYPEYVPYNQMTFCRRVVYADGYNGSPAKRKMCPTCFIKLRLKKP